MSAMVQPPPSKEDPRYLRAMVDLAGELSGEHEIQSVFVGIAGEEGDLLVPEFIEFVESALRMDDRIFRLLRERAVLLLVDVAEDRAREIVDRLRQDFISRYGPSASFDLEMRFVAIPKRSTSVSVKSVLPSLFADSA